MEGKEGEPQQDRQFLQSQKVEAIGRLVGGIAHDINNYLGATTGFAELVKMKYDRDTLLDGKMNAIINSSLSASSLIDQLLSFSKKQPVQPEVNDFNRVLEAMQDMIRRLIGEDIEFTARTASDLETIKIDPSQLEQVLVNLVINSLDAMPRGGEIVVETRNVKIDESSVMQYPEGREGRFVMLSVADTGVGIQDDIRDKLFEPFFTTKDKDKSSGLATVYGIVEQNEGFIQFESEVGRGTMFSVYFPACSEKEPHSRERITGEVKKISGSGRILLVEDNDDIRTFTKLLLETMGFSALVASNGEEAIKIFDSLDRGVDLLITDIVMPGLGGKDLVEYLQTKKSDIKALFMSGYTDEIIHRHGIMNDFIDFMPKPFTAADLAAHIKNILYRDD